MSILNEYLDDKTIHCERINPLQRGLMLLFKLELALHVQVRLKQIQLINRIVLLEWYQHIRHILSMPFTCC